MTHKCPICGSVCDEWDEYCTNGHYQFTDQLAPAQRANLKQEAMTHENLRHHPAPRRQAR